MRSTLALPRLLMLALLWLLAAAASAASDEPPGRVGRIADTQGAVWMYDVDDSDWTQAERNRPVTGGDRLSTDADARAELNIGSAVLRLDGGTEVQMLELDDRRVRIQLERGGLALRLRSAELAREFEVVTAEGRFLPQRAGHVRIDRQGDTSFAGAWSGALRFEARDSALDLGAGQRAEFWRDGSGPTQYTWSQIEPDGFADWVLAQDARDRRNEREWASRELSPEMTGAGDLDRYGQWDRHPEYGSVWYPTAVAAGWAPYRYGRWAWVRPWGWTWVDDAPWGFAPFHYGRWVNWRGRWCWTPGGYAARPVYSPALVGWVGGPSIGIGIHVGGRPSLPPYVGWVPLGPRDHYRPPYRYRDRDRDRYPKPVPTGPIMYSNQGVPGGVTVVPSQVMRERQRISTNVVSRVDPQVLREASRQPVTAAYTPPPPVTRVVAQPGGAVPASPPSRLRSREAEPSQARINHLDSPAARGSPGPANAARDDDTPVIKAPRSIARPEAQDRPAPQATVPPSRNLPTVREAPASRDARGFAETRDGRDVRDTRDAAAAREQREARDAALASREAREQRDARDTMARQQREAAMTRDAAREAREARMPQNRPDDGDGPAQRSNPALRAAPPPAPHQGQPRGDAPSMRAPSPAMQAPRQTEAPRAPPAQIERERTPESRGNPRERQQAR